MEEPNAFKVIRYHGVLPPLVALWRRSVEASHDFLQPEDIDFYQGAVINALPHVELWAAIDLHGQVLGFIGLNKKQVEMLFVDPLNFSHGVGKALLDQALSLKKKLQVYVNEQNPKAHAFYQKYGFQPIARLPLDGSGRPFPLIQMELAG